MSSPLTSNHNPTGTTTLSLAAVKVLSRRLAPVPATKHFPSTKPNESPSCHEAHPPSRSQIQLASKPQMTAKANARLPSKLFPPTQYHFVFPNRRPIRLAAAS